MYQAVMTKRLSVCVRALHQAQEQAWARGEVRVPLRALRPRQRGKKQEFAPPPDEPRTISLADAAGPLDEYARTHVRGLADLQVSPGMVRSKARYHRRDPHQLSDEVTQFVHAQGWTERMGTASVAVQWEKIVGPQVSSHTQVESIEDAQLLVRASSTAWATHLRMLIPTIMANIDQVVGEGVVRKVIVVGPHQRSWRHGKRSVPGRGPRDTYG